MTVLNEPTIPAIDFDGVYKRRDWGGVAWRLVGWAQRWEPAMILVPAELFGAYDLDDEDLEWVEIEDPCEGEWVDDPQSGHVQAYMVGDGHIYNVDVTDLTQLNEDDYCSCCGQIGCGWG